MRTGPLGSAPLEQWTMSRLAAAERSRPDPRESIVNVAQPTADEPSVSRASRASGVFSPLAVSLVVLAVVLVAASWSTRRIQDDLTARSRTALAAAGLPSTVSVRYDGLDAILTGTVTHPQQAADAIGALIGVAGTRHVTSRLTMPASPWAPPASTPGAGGTAPGKATPEPSATGIRLPPGKITFATNDAQLSAAARAYLEQVATFLAEYPQVQLAVRGHSDNSGTDEINWMLSRQRAAAVVAYLVSRQVAAQRLRPAAFAATSPVASNDTPDGRAANRRVDLAIEENP
jgi:outer membrane protein OmpA-like peptidoglycan-associated protein